MAGAQVAISAEPASTTIATADILVAVVAGTTKKITAGNFRTSLFAFAAADPLNIGALTCVGNSTITGSLSGVTTFACAAITTSGDFNYASDSVYDFGKAGSGRARHGYFGGNLSASGTCIFGVTSVLGTFSVGTSVTGYRSSFSSSADPYAVQVTRSGQSAGPYIGASVSATVPDMIFSNNAGTELARFTDGGTFKLATASTKIVPGSSQLSFRNNADSADNLIIVDAGSATFRAAVVVGTNLSFTASVAKILKGATSLSIRDNADTTDLMLFNASGITLAQSLITTASVTGGSGFRVPHGTAPTSPVDGDLWSTTTTLNFRLNGVTKAVTLT